MAPDPHGPQRVEVVTSVQRRRRWSAAERVRLVEEATRPGMSVSYVARPHGIAPGQLFGWKRRMLEGGLQAVATDEDVVGSSRVRDLERRVRQLGRLSGRKTMEVEILKEALDLARQKTRLAAQLVARGAFTMKAVVDTLDVARSNLARRAAAPAYFSGTDAVPAWTGSYTGRKPILTALGQSYRSGISYSKARGRYYWWRNNGDSKDTHRFEVWSAPNSWGSWRRVYYTARWDMNPDERGEFLVTWMGPEPIGKLGNLHLLFSGYDWMMNRKATIAAGH